LQAGASRLVVNLEFTTALDYHLASADRFPSSACSSSVAAAALLAQQQQHQQQQQLQQQFSLPAFAVAAATGSQAAFLGAKLHSVPGLIGSLALKYFSGVLNFFLLIFTV